MALDGGADLHPFSVMPQELVRLFETDSSAVRQVGADLHEQTCSLRSWFLILSSLADWPRKTLTGAGTAAARGVSGSGSGSRPRPGFNGSGGTPAAGLCRSSRAVQPCRCQPRRDAGSIACSHSTAAPSAPMPAVVCNTCVGVNGTRLAESLQHPAVIMSWHFSTRTLP